MNVLHLNTYTKGGAASAVYRLHKNLKKIGLNSHVLVLNDELKNQEVTGVIKSNTLFRISRRIYAILDRIKNKSAVYDYYFYPGRKNHLIGNVNRLLKNVPFAPDVIVAHWVSDFVTVRELYDLSVRKKIPVFWHLLDMAPITGGCHYAWDCKGYEKECGCCPALKSANADDRSHKNLEKKRRYLKNAEISFIAASTTLYSQARRASVATGKEVYRVLLGIDPRVFKIGDREKAKEHFGLKKSKISIFFAASYLDEKRKGIEYLLKMIEFLKKDVPEVYKKCSFFCAGTKFEKKRFSNVKELKYLGQLDSDKLLVKAYQAADIFLCPSIEDSGPMMINEALMCGTPVVAFDMGIAPDLVLTGKTGYRAKLRDYKDLANGVKSIVVAIEAKAVDFETECRNMALEKCDPIIQAEAFRCIFSSQLTKTKE